MKNSIFTPQAFDELESLRVPLAVYRFVDKHVNTLVLSDGFRELFGYEDKEQAYLAMDNNMYENTHPDDVARVASETFRFATEGGKYEVIYRTFSRAENRYIVVHAFGEHVYSPDGTCLAYIWYTNEGIYSDETVNTRGLSDSLCNALHEESLLKANRYDFLTGLPSMSYFFELADERRKEIIAENRTMALLFLDLCGMKFYNRKYGFSEGDKLLRGVSAVLKKHFGSENCSRFSSDRFGVFADSEGIEEKLHEVFDELNTIEGAAPLHVRVGICLDSTGTLDISTECDRAKYACDTLRNIYESRFCYFNESMLERADDRQYIIDNIDRAIAEKWIQVYYQPLVRAANGRVCDEEALARWVDPEKGMIPPSEFIPVLEDARLVYKLDLYIVEQVLEKLKLQQKNGLHLVGNSVNLSRVDFDTCDIVEEVRRRVDASGMPRNLINIEVTESAVSDDIEFMKAQIERFRSLGFKVWMDDFGSGYSSLDSLQSMKFDFIKFDMRFMKEFDQSDKSRIILTELIRMTLALGIESVCEGVETYEQVEFLREIGCTMLQGYYFCRPIPVREIFERYEDGTQIGFENPEESGYFASVGRVNLYDLAVVANEDRETIGRYFNTVPMGVIETDGEEFRLLRCNSTFRSFMESSFGQFSFEIKLKVSEADKVIGSGFSSLLRHCGENGNKMLIDEELVNGSVAQVFMKRIAENPVKNTKAVAVAILSVTDAKRIPTTFTQVARALSSDYINLYYVNVITDTFIEYTPSETSGDLTAERRGEDFFEASRKDAMRLISGDDLERFFEVFTKENILRDIEEQSSFNLSYSLLIDGVPTPVRLKAVRVRTDPNRIIIGVSHRYNSPQED